MLEISCHRNGKIRRQMKTSDERDCNTAQTEMPYSHRVFYMVFQRLTFLRPLTLQWVDGTWPAVYLYEPTPDIIITVQWIEMCSWVAFSLPTVWKSGLKSVPHLDGNPGSPIKFCVWLHDLIQLFTFVLCSLRSAKDKQQGAKSRTI